MNINDENNQSNCNEQRESSENGSILYRLIETNNASCDKSPIIERQHVNKLDATLKVSSVSLKHTPTKRKREKRKISWEKRAQTSRFHSRLKGKFTARSQSNQDLLNHEINLQRNAQSYNATLKWSKNSFQHRKLRYESNNHASISIMDTFTPRSVSHDMVLNDMKMHNQIVKDISLQNSVKRVYSVRSNREFEQKQKPTKLFDVDIAGQTKHDDMSLNPETRFRIKHQIKQNLLNMELCKSETQEMHSWKPSWIQIYKNDRNHHASFQAFYISKIVELYVYDQIVNTHDCIVNDSLLDTIIDTKLNQIYDDKQFIPFSSKIDSCLQAAFCIDLLKMLKAETPNHKLLIHWVMSQFLFLIYDNYDNKTNKFEIEHLSFAQTHKLISQQRKDNLRKLMIQLRSNKLLVARAFVSLTSYKVTIQRIFYTWRLYCRRKNVSHVIAKKLTQMRQIKKDIFFQWRDYASKSKILKLQEEIENLQTQLRRQTIDSFVFKQQAISFNNQQHAIKSVLIAACDFLNEKTCHQCNHQWTSKYVSSFEKQFSQNVFLKNIL